MTTENTDQDKFGGDYAKLSEAYNALQSKMGEQSNKINSLSLEIQNSNKTIQNLQNAPSPAQPDAGSGGSLYDWANGSMRAQDGSLDPGLVSALGTVGATPEQVEAIVSSVEEAGAIVQQQVETSINSRFGNKQNYDAALTWAQDNLDQTNKAAITTLLANRTTAAAGMDMLQKAAQEGGLKFDNTNTQTTPTTNEPAKLPESSSSGGGGLTPIKPHTKEAEDLMKEAFATGDPVKVAEYEARLEAGMRSG